MRGSAAQRSDLLAVGLGVLAFMVLLIAVTINNRGPIHTAACSLEGRSGWTIDLPEEPVRLDEFRALISDQTRNCVRAEVAGPEDDAAIVIRPIGARTWVGSSRKIQLTSEDGNQ